jgi:hypothetical protein
MSSSLPDPFAINPIRRSLLLVAVCCLVIVGPLPLGAQAVATVMLTVGWLAMSGLAIGMPILLLSLIAEGYRQLRRRLRPTLTQLDLSPRVAHILHRHGYEAIAEIDCAPDAELLLLSNMDKRGLHELRRAITLRTYPRRQESRFPANAVD